MSLTGSWINIHSPEHSSSVDFGTDSYASSWVTETFEAPREHATSTVIAVMSTSIIAQDSLENIAPIASGTDNWVHGQAKQNLSRDAASIRRAQNLTPPPRPIPSNDAYTKRRCRSACNTNREPEKLVYSIETLLTLRETQRNMPVMLRVKPEAIAGEIHEYSRGHRLTQLIQRRQRIFSSTWELTEDIGLQPVPAVCLKYQTSPEVVLTLIIMLLTLLLAQGRWNRLFANPLLLLRHRCYNAMMVSHAS